MGNRAGQASPGADGERQYHEDHTIPDASWVWVFGSNLLGRHGLGAAKVAHKNFGARYGVGSGPTGQAYAIPTKARPTRDPRDVLPLEEIAGSVMAFLQYARAKPGEKFFITRVGCGLSGLEDSQVAPMFAGAPPNCSLPSTWRRWVAGGGGLDDAGCADA